MKHNQTIKYFYLLFIWLFLAGCDVSCLSDKEFTDLSVIKAKILIEETYSKFNKIKVFISDGEKQIINENIKVKVNGNFLKLLVINELYYTTSSYYTNIITKKDKSGADYFGEIFPRSNSYYFEIILPDSTVYPLAYIKSLNQDDMDSIQISTPKTISKTEDFILKWHNLNNPFQLTIGKGTLNKETKVFSTSACKTHLIKTAIAINSKNGEHLISASSFEDSLKITEYLDFNFYYENSGLISPDLMKESSISYEFIVNQVVWIEK